MTVRLARPADDPVVAVLVERLQGARSSDPEGLVAFVRSSREEGVVVVAEDSDGLAGFAAATANGAELGVYLEPEVRGLATANRLLDALERGCAARGAYAVIYTPRPDRARAGALYGRRGCERYGGTWIKRLCDPVVV